MSRTSRRKHNTVQLGRSPVTARRRGALLEPLETRVLLSQMVWTNRGSSGSDSDSFEAEYGSFAVAQTARAVVDAAINAWEEVIVDFNYSGGGNTFYLDVDAADLGGGGRGVTTGIGVDGDGRPTDADITMDDDGGGAGWWFDTTPSDDAEFTTLLSAFTANGPNSLNGNDFYRTIVHEIGHAVGILVGGSQAINNYMVNSGTADPNDGSADLWLFTGASIIATLTDNGGGHLYEGPAVGGMPTHPNDLMNAGRTVGFPPPTRELITDTDAKILKDAYNYEIALPSTLNTFYANFNQTTGVLTINGAPGPSNDNIFVDISGGVRVQVNGTEEILAGGLVTSINVLAGAGDDHVVIDNAIGMPVTVDGGDGNDDLIGGDVTLIGGIGDDYLEGTASADSLDGGDGNDTLVGLAGNDTLVGGIGNDEMYGGTGSNSINDGTGNDLLDFSENAVAVNISTGGGTDTVQGSAYADTMTGTSGAERFFGNAGDDILQGNGGSDDLHGGEGNDDLRFGNGVFGLADGGEGNDQMDLGTNQSEITLYHAGSQLVIDYGVNTLIAGDIEGVRVLYSEEATLEFRVKDLATTTVTDVEIRINDDDGDNSAIIVEGSSIADDIGVALGPGPSSLNDSPVVTTRWGRVVISGSDASALQNDKLIVQGLGGDDVIDADLAVTDGPADATVRVHLDGGDGNDLLIADATLMGGTGNDTLIGGVGNDTLLGGDGDDVLDGRGGDNTVDGGEDGDTILVSGTNGQDSITVTKFGGLLGVAGGPSTGSSAFANVENVRIEAGAGSDDITLDLDTLGGLNYDVLGGDPIGAVGDVLTISTADNASFTPGPESDSGGFVIASDVQSIVSFDEIEALSFTGGGNLGVNGTNDDDTITVIARDDSTHAPADGVQDFTVAVNAFPEILFIDTANVLIKALAGDDLINIIAPAPNEAVWDVDVTVDGGPPSASDRLVVETPYVSSDTAIYTPTGVDSGEIDLVNLSSLIAISGVEELVYDGRNDDDTLTVLGTSGDDVIVHTPGANNTSGTLAVNDLLALEYQDLGLGATLTVDAGDPAASDVLRYDGTALNDVFIIGTTQTVTLNARLALNSANVETLQLEGLGGDDIFRLVPAVQSSPYATLLLNGGSHASAAGDRADFIATGGDDSLALSGQNFTAGSVNVNGTGLENINLGLLGGADTLTYNGVLGVTDDVQVIASTTAGNGQIKIAGLAQYTFTGGEFILANGNVDEPDTLTFIGTNNPDTFRIDTNVPVGSVGSPVLKLTNAAAATLLTLVDYTGFNTLNVLGLDGADRFNVYTGPVYGRDLFLDGGTPTAKKKLTDKLYVYYVMPRPHIVHSTAIQGPRTGLVELDYGTSETFVKYAEMEDVIITKV